jgi:hypothetical protein
MKESREALRRRLAYEAARIMADQRLPDPGAACRKAAQRLGCGGTRHWPSRDEVEEALRAQQRLFRGEHQRRALEHLRHRALEAMEVLSEFRPRLVGPVLDGTADVHSPIELHLFCDDPGAVAQRLTDLGISWRDGDKRLRYGRGEHRLAPVFRFQAGETPMELVVMSTQGLRQRPLAPGAERPMERASRDHLRRLIAEEASGWPE